MLSKRVRNLLLVGLFVIALAGVAQTYAQPTIQQATTTTSSDTTAYTSTSTSYSLTTITNISNSPTTIVNVYPIALTTRTTTASLTTISNIINVPVVSVTTQANPVVSVNAVSQTIVHETSLPDQETVFLYLGVILAILATISVLIYIVHKLYPKQGTATPVVMYPIEQPLVPMSMQPIAPAVLKFCPTCKTSVGQADAFCDKCGTRLR